MDSEIIPIPKNMKKMVDQLLMAICEGGDTLDDGI